jgi:LacI family transcriptional regulator
VPDPVIRRKSVRGERAALARVTVRQVALRAGVSTATVSRALAGFSHVADDLRQRVLDAARALDYRPNRAARSLRSRRSLTVGVLVPDVQNPFFTGILRGLEAVLEGDGFTFLLGNSDGRPERERLYIDTMRDEGVAGFIVVPTHGDLEPYRLLQSRGVPIVTIDRSAPGLKADQVTVTNREGVRGAVHHLVALGHRRIGFIGGPARVDVARERAAGYEQAMGEHHIDVDPTLVQPGDFQQTGGYRGMQALLETAERPTAVFVANNLMTLGALQALHEHDVRIPHQVALIGFDDMPWATSLQPPLTAVAQPTNEIGVAAAQLLVARLRDPDRPFRRVVLETQLIVRGSCGAPSAEARRGGTDAGQPAAAT